MMPAALSILILGIFIQAGCSGGPPAPLEMTTLDPVDDHQKIALHYRHEAVLARQQAEELTNQAAVYERLFGRESDWVSGTRLLIQFYEDVAGEQDRLADLHQKFSKDRSSTQPSR
jgi:hypothetical protein